VERAPGSGGAHAGQSEGSGGSPEQQGTDEGRKTGPAEAISGERWRLGAIPIDQSGEGE
jgi:hypothetical protein